VTGQAEKVAKHMKPGRCRRGIIAKHDPGTKSASKRNGPAGSDMNKDGSEARTDRGAAVAALWLRVSGAWLAGATRAAARRGGVGRRGGAAAAVSVRGLAAGCDEAAQRCVGYCPCPG